MPVALVIPLASLLEYNAVPCYPFCILLYIYIKLIYGLNRLSIFLSSKVTFIFYIVLCVKFRRNIHTPIVVFFVCDFDCEHCSSGQGHGIPLYSLVKANSARFRRVFFVSHRHRTEFFVDFQGKGK